MLCSIFPGFVPLVDNLLHAHIAVQREESHLVRCNPVFPSHYSSYPPSWFSPSLVFVGAVGNIRSQLNRSSLRVMDYLFGEYVSESHLPDVWMDRTRSRVLNWVNVVV